jgi:uncharacterized protein
MILVADCSALIALATCDGLHLLDRLFGSVVVPEAVYREAVTSDKPQARQLQAYLHGRVKMIDPSYPILVDGVSDLGETEAMILYRQLAADRLLIDDRRGRRVARINGIEIIGCIVGCETGGADRRGQALCPAAIRFRALPVQRSDRDSDRNCGGEVVIKE